MKLEYQVYRQFIVWSGLKWMLMRNKLLELEKYNLRFGWHEYLKYYKVKFNIHFKKNHFIRYGTLRIWNK